MLSLKPPSMTTSRLQAKQVAGDHCCRTRNRSTSSIEPAPGQITNAFVVSSEGLGAMDQYHFNLAAQREFGKRYGQKMIEALGD
ncbi:sialate O-acetylesterase [Sorangium sp. So ce1335]|uniref:sialate O-acetylesterase n=1 Tax=Sorangium sp. So ce1335 TaxID=3133335 RepID=UPI003F60E8CF